MMATRSARRDHRRRASRFVLAAVVVVLAAVLVPIQVVFYSTPLPVALLLGFGLCAAPLLALIVPWGAIAVFCVSAMVLAWMSRPESGTNWPWPWPVPALLAFLVSVFVLTRLHGWRPGLIALGAGNTIGLLSAAARPEAAAADVVRIDLIVVASLTTGSLLVALLLAGRARTQEEVGRERALTAAEQARRMLVEDRTRIARDLHDVVAHSLSRIQVQAASAPYRLPELAPDAAAEFAEIAAVARGSLTEMRRLLDVLRTDDHQSEVAPQQTIDDVEPMVCAMRRAGVEATVSVTGNTGLPPPGVQITTFRVVQEAVSNAVRHAARAAISVEISVGAEVVSVRVHNEPVDDAQPSQEARPSQSDRAGYGLRGMAERVALVAGTLQAGPNPAGGWTVCAELPWRSLDEPSMAKEPRGHKEES
ncbi:MAG: sensor histidine kinase [Propioniciclava sp.]